MKNLITGLVLFCIFPSLLFVNPVYCQESGKNESASSAPGITVEDAIQFAFKNYPQVQQADQEINASRARLRQKQSSYYPSLALEAQYTRLEPDPSLTFPGYGAIQLYPEDNYDVHLALHHSLWDFGRTSSQVSAARFDLSAAEKNSTLIKMNLAFETIRTFYSILLLQESIDVQQQEIETLEENLLFTKKKVASGSATEFDLLTTKVKVSEAQSRKIDLENNFKKQQIELCRLTGICDETSIVIKGGFSQDSVKLDEDKLISAAVNNRLEMQIARDRENRARQIYYFARSDNNPSFNINVLYGQKNGYFPDINEIQTDFTGNVQLSMPLFSGLRTFHQIKEAKANLSSAQSQKKDIEDYVIAQVRQAVSDVQASSEKLKVSELHVKLAREALIQAKVRYKNGLITNLDLLNAESSLAQAELLHVQALHDYTLDVDALKKSVGIKLWNSK